MIRLLRCADCLAVGLRSDLSDAWEYDGADWRHDCTRSIEEVVASAERREPSSLVRAPMRRPLPWEH